MTADFKDCETMKMVEFIREVGIEVILAELPEDTFIPGIFIKEGKLLVNEEELLYPGDLLHEAAHIAMIPSHLRKHATDNVGKSPEIGDSYEVESICWSYAAVLHLGMNPEILFHNKGYRGNAQNLLFGFTLGVYPGIVGLEKAKMAFGSLKSAEMNIEPFPSMEKWLRD